MCCCRRYYRPGANGGILGLLAGMVLGPLLAFVLAANLPKIHWALFFGLIFGTQLPTAVLGYKVERKLYP